MKLYTHDNKLLKANENEFFISLEEIPAEPVKQTYFWKGPLIPFESFARCMSFLLWTQEEHKSEGVVTFFYNTETKEWAEWAFPQTGIGLTVEHDEEDKAFIEQRKQFGKGWIQLGSIHHHCTSKAFQSSTDHEDEFGRDGIHITIGTLDKPVLDWHARAMLGESLHDVTSLADWVALPLEIKAEKRLLFPAWLEKDTKAFIFQNGLLLKHLYEKVEFPEIWKENYTKGTYTWAGGYSNQGYYGSSRTSSPPAVSYKGTQKKEEKKQIDLVDTISDDVWDLFWELCSVEHTVSSYQLMESFQYTDEQLIEDPSKAYATDSSIADLLRVRNVAIEQMEGITTQFTPSQLVNIAMGLEA